MDAREFEIFTSSGYFAIRRVKKVVKFWEGISGDMTIEQWLMKAFKAIGGGLTSHGFSETIVAKWLHSLHGSVEHIMALQDFCGLSTGSSEQHVEMRDSRRKTDSAHLSKMVLWLVGHSPFTRPANLLVSLANGIVGSEDVNCDRAEEVGRKCMSEMVGKTFEDLHLRREDKVTPLGNIGKSVKIGERAVVMIDSMQLFHRIICVVKDEPDLRTYFSFELAPTPLSLFDSMGFSRKGTKAMLVPAFSEYSAAGLEMPSNPKYTIDGGYLLHKVVWSCPTDFAEISAGYIAFVKRHYNSSPVVVFDGYQDVVVENTTLLTLPKSKFLANEQNKRNFVKLLAANLREAHIQVVEATGDADQVIVSTSIKRAQSNPFTNHVVVGEDTDLLVLVIALTPDDTNLHFLKPGKGATKNQVFSSQTLRQKLGQAAAHLLFLHAASGCDTTSARFGKGKKHALSKLVKSTSAFKTQLEVFNQADSTHDAVADVGEAFMLLLYGAPARFKCLNEYRFYLYMRIISKQALTTRFTLASLPPTKSAARQFFYRVYLQVQAWRGQILDPTAWGFQRVSGYLRAVWSTQEVAPPELLKLIACGCRGMCDTQRCECLKSGLRCSSICGFCQGHSCANRADDDDDNEESVDDPV
ncbi:Chromosome-associated kinesin KIF4 [Frankliniella fusca]|uniref:Chromosome-associated kinesin KIF4 n=1 Tax=Frankliniella fusca TaxID=407009 RepID=A0AAE1HBI9_9NEOP|nr:Chromosome-associated kinesin KIF4 [Frankliniella fusca]